MEHPDPRERERWEAHGVSRATVANAASSAADGEVRLVEGERPVLVATGIIGRTHAAELADQIRALDPQTVPTLTVDLRAATSLDPLVVHALLHAWERRQESYGSVRLLVSEGAVERFLDALGLERAFVITRPEEQSTDAPPVLTGEEWRAAQRETAAHYQRLLDTARREDLPALRAAALEAHPICVASGAQAEGPAFGHWCDHCPLRHQYGGCQPLLQHAVRAAEHGNWEATELLLMALIAEVVGMRLPES